MIQFSPIQEPTTMSTITTSISGPTSILACTAMAVTYVAILYAPTLLLRLPPPTSLTTFLRRRFASALFSSALSAILTASLIGCSRFADFRSLLSLFGIRADHMWQAVVFPFVLTSLVYSGSMVAKLMGKRRDGGGSCSQGFGEWICGLVYDVMVWRNYVVAPFTEELVFRACMIPLLLCGGFKIFNIIFLSPIFFSLAHLNHFMELYFQQKFSFMKAFLIVGLQLGYTVVFGWYAAFLFIRTGNLISPIVAHIVCNVMGLPALSSPGTKGVVTFAFAAGTACFFWLLFPASSPDIYNDTTDDCSCWHGYCSWR